MNSSLRLLASALAFAGLGAVAFAQTTPAPAPNASPAPQAPAPTAPPPQPSATTSVPPAPAPTQTQISWGWTYAVPQAADAAPDAPKILEVDLLSFPLRIPGHTAVRVLTSPDVVQVTMRALGRETQLPRVAEGMFGLQYDIPSMVRFFVRQGAYDVDLYAFRSDGRSTQAKVPVQVAF